MSNEKAQGPDSLPLSHADVIDTLREFRPRGRFLVGLLSGEPFVHGGFGWMTDGVWCARCRLDNADDQELDEAGAAWVKRMKALDWSAFGSASTTWSPLPSEFDWCAIVYDRCPRGCFKPIDNGDGTWSSIECSVCDGHGVIPGCDVRINGRRVNLHRLVRLHETFARPMYAVERKPSAVQPILVRDEEHGFQAILMPCTPDESTAAPAEASSDG